MKGGENALYQVKEMRLQFEQIVLEGESGELLFFNNHDFYNRVARGEFWPLYASVPELAAVVPVRVLTIRERAELDHRLEVLSCVNRCKQQGHCWVDIFVELQKTCPDRLPSMRTVQRWYRESLACSDQTDLAPRFAGRGNRSQLVPDIRSILLDVVEEMYCASDRFNLTNITVLVNVKNRELCRNQGIPFNGISRRSVGRFLRVYATFDRFRERMDPRTLRKALTPALQYLDVEVPYERVEFDATPLNVLVVDAQGNIIGKPTLYLMIDCATRCIVAFHLSIQAESQHTFLKLLEMAFHPRDGSFLERYGVEKTLAPCAMWQVMAGDNSASHHGEAMYRALRYLGCTVEFTQAGKPEQHPFAERIHGSLKTGLVQMLAGSHISQEKLEKEALDRAMCEARYSLSELETWVARWFCEVYMDRPLDRLTTKFKEPCSPRRAMEILSKQFPMLPPPTPEDFRAACMNYSVKHVSLTTKGIRYQAFEYNSDELQKLLMRSPRGCKVEVRSHPLDVSRVSVVSLEDQKLMVTAYNKAKGLPAMSFEEAKLIRKKFYQSDASISAEEYAQGYSKLMTDIHQANSAPRVSAGRKLARAKDKQVETARLHDASHAERRLGADDTGVAGNTVDLSGLKPAPRRNKEQ